MTILILGSEGQLGRELKNLFSDSVALRHTNEGGIDLSSEADRIVDVIQSYDPEVIINASAMTNVDKCELERDAALKINGTSLKHLTRAAQSVGAYLIHISTDYVFDGKEGNYQEDSSPNPINYYGLSKLIGDIYVNSYANSIVVRTSGVFGHASNFPKFAYDTLKLGKDLNILEGYYSPIHAHLLAEAISEILEYQPLGLLNIAGEKISRFELARRLCYIYGFDQDLLHNSLPKLKLIAKRPFDSSLNIDKARKLITSDFSSVEKGLRLLAKLPP